MDKDQKRKKRLREPVNGLTHLAGALLASVGLVVLLATAARADRADQLVAFGIFGLSLIALYTASTLYHLLPLSPRGVAGLRRLDHMMIFVLIAGTYTPFCLLALDGAWWVGFLCLIYGLKRPNLVPGVFGFHELWHLFVVGGSACHFWALLWYIAPLA